MGSVARLNIKHRISRQAGFVVYSCAHDVALRPSELRLTLEPARHRVAHVRGLARHTRHPGDERGDRERFFEPRDAERVEVGARSFHHTALLKRGRRSKRRGLAGDSARGPFWIVFGNGWRPPPAGSAANNEYGPHGGIVLNSSSSLFSAGFVAFLIASARRWRRLHGISSGDLPDHQALAESTSPLVLKPASTPADGTLVANTPASARLLADRDDPQSQLIAVFFFLFFTFLSAEEQRTSYSHHRRTIPRASRAP